MVTTLESGMSEHHEESLQKNPQFYLRPAHSPCQAQLILQP